MANQKYGKAKTKTLPWEPRVPEADNLVAPSPVKNDSLKRSMSKFKKEPTRENNVEFLNEVVNARLLIPISMDKEVELDNKTGEVVIDKDTEIRFELIRSSSNQLYYPVFTDGKEIKKCDEEVNKRIMIVNFLDLAAFLQAQEGVSGFVIDPKGDNMIFPKEMVIAMKEEMAREDGCQAE